MKSFTALLFLCGISGASAAEPFLEKIDLFQNDIGGYAHYRIPGIVVTTKGTVLAYCEGRLTAGWGCDTIQILLRRSTDEGPVARVNLKWLTDGHDHL